jgi:hypothetical protein
MEVIGIIIAVIIVIALVDAFGGDVDDIDVEDLQDE